MIRMQTTARSQVGMTIGKMVKLYLDAEACLHLSVAQHAMTACLRFKLRLIETARTETKEYLTLN